MTSRATRPAAFSRHREQAGRLRAGDAGLASMVAGKRAATGDCYQRAFGLNVRMIDEEGRFATMNSGAMTLPSADETAADETGVSMRPNRRRDRGRTLGCVRGLNRYLAGRPGRTAR